MKNNILDTGVKNVKNVGGYVFENESINRLRHIVENFTFSTKPHVLVFLDCALLNNKLIKNQIEPYQVIIIDTAKEPSTDSIDKIMLQLKDKTPDLIIGIGGGNTMDTAKACSNLFTNPGKASDYQGWDLVKNKGILKMAIPTISGTGSEATRTCVMTNSNNGLKLGMNSDFTVFDYIIMDPSLSSTVPRNQFFYTGMDAYIHCLESLEGIYRNPIGDSFSNQTLALCRDIFSSDNMMSDSNREKMMVASYLGGCSIATSYVGLIHPFSAGLTVVLGIHHCLANCIVLNSMEEYYPKFHKEFNTFLSKQKVDIPKDVCSNLNEETYRKLYNSTIIHEKPHFNALGENYKEILNFERVKNIFSAM